jgi:MFS transporter, DHA1 family, tetracycline resistance protein
LLISIWEMEVLDAASTGPLAGAPRYGRLALYSIVFVDAVGFGLLIPVLPYLALHFGASAALVTQIPAVYYLAAFLSTPHLGRFSDLIGRANVLLLTVLAGVISCAGLLLSTSIAGLIVFRAFGGAASGNSAIAQALVTDGLPKEKHVNALSTLGAVRNVGTIAGPALGGAVAAIIGSRYQYEAVLGLAFILAVSTAGLTVAAFGRDLDFKGISSRLAKGMARSKSSLESSRSERGAFLRPILLPLIGTALVSFPTGILFSVTALYVKYAFGWEAAQTGLLLGLCTGAVVASRLFVIPRMNKRFSLPFNNALMATVATLSTMLIPLAKGPVLFTLVYIVFSASCSGALVFTGAAVSIHSDPRKRGQSLGLNSAAFSLSLVVSSSLNGVIFGYLGPRAPFYLGAAILAAFSLGSWGAQYFAARRAALV